MSTSDRSSEQDHLAQMRRSTALVVSEGLVCKPGAYPGNFIGQGLNARDDGG